MGRNLMKPRNRIIKALTKGVAAALLLIACLPAPGQSNAKGITPQPNQTDSRLTADTRRAFLSISDNIVKAARQMPEASYSFKPADGTRTFGELVAHVADVQSTLCGSMNGEPAAKTAAKNESQESIVKGLVP